MNHSDWSDDEFYEAVAIPSNDCLYVNPDEGASSTEREKHDRMHKNVVKEPQKSPEMSAAEQQSNVSNNVKDNNATQQSLESPMSASVQQEK